MHESMISLEEVLEELRVSLSRATKAADDKDLQFHLKHLDLEFQVAVTKEAAAEGTLGGKLKFWVLNADASLKATGKYSRAQTQTVRLHLEPKKSDGREIPLSTS